MIAVEDEVFAEAQFGTYDDAKATALKIKRQRKRTNSRSHSSEGNDDPVSPMSDEFPKVSSTAVAYFHAYYAMFESVVTLDID